MASTPLPGTYSPQVSALDLPRRVTPFRSEGGSPIAEGLGAVGQALEQKQRSDETTAAANAVSALHLQSLQLLKDQQANAQPGANGFTPQLLGAFDKQADQLVSQFRGQRYAGPMVEAGIRNVRENLASHAIGFEAAEQVAYKRQSIGTTRDNAASVLQIDPSQLGSQLALIHAQTLNAGIGVDGIREETAKTDRELPYYAALGQANLSPRSVYDALKSNDATDPVVSRVTDPVSREHLLQYASAKVASTTADGIVNTYRQLGPKAGSLAYMSIDKTDLPDDIKAQVREHVAQGLGQWHEQQRQGAAPQLIGLEDRLLSGQTSPADKGLAWDLYQKGALTADQTGSTLGRIDAAELAAIPDTSGVQWVDRAYRNGNALDPKDGDVKKWSATWFANASKGVPAGSSAWINLASDFAAKTGVVPDPAISWSRAQLVSGAPDTAALAAQAVDRMTQASPRGVGYAIDEGAKVMARQIVDMTTAGTTPAQAVATARKTAEMPDAERERLGEVYRKQQVALSSESSLLSQVRRDTKFDTGFLETKPELPPLMVGEYEKLRHDYFVATGGNVDQASKLAMDDLRRTWGVTRVNGAPELIQYAPEAMYPGLSTQAVRADLEASAKGHTDDPTKVRLIPSPYTHVTDGQAWYVGVPDKSGAYDVLRGSDNRPLTYALPNPAAAMRAEKDRADAAGMAAARARQANERAGMAAMDEDLARASRMGIH